MRAAQRPGAQRPGARRPRVRRAGVRRAGRDLGRRLSLWWRAPWRAGNGGRRDASRWAALAGCCVLAAAIVMGVPRRNGGDAVPEVDYGPDLARLRVLASFTSYAPEGLDAGWRPIGSRLTTDGGHVAWHLAFLSPAGDLAAVEQSDEPAGDFITRMTNRPRPEDTRWIAGSSWARYWREDKRQRSLVRRLPDVTLVVTGTVSDAELAYLASSLHRQPRARRP